MTDLRMALLELLSKYKEAGKLNALREGVRLLVQALMEREVSEKIGAERYRRTKGRKTYRNGYRRRRWDTRVGTIMLRVPKHAQAEVTAWVRTIFAQPNRGMARKQPELVAAHLERRSLEVAGYFREAREDVLSWMTFPSGHRRRIHSTNPLERTLRECDGDLSQLPGGLTADRGSAGREAERVGGYFSQASMATLYGPHNGQETSPEEVLTG